MQSDIEIAQAAQPQRIDAIAEKAGIDDKYLEMYGKYKAKVDYNLLRENEHTPGKLRYGDVEAVLAGHAVGFAAETVDDVAQLSVVHVDHALPGDLAHIDAELVAVVDMRVGGRGQDHHDGRSGRCACEAR